MNGEKGGYKKNLGTTKKGGNRRDRREEKAGGKKCHQTKGNRETQQKGVTRGEDPIKGAVNSQK